jgi:hypothetical protein
LPQNWETSALAYDVHIDDEVDEPEKGEKTLVKFLAFLADKLKSVPDRQIQSIPDRQIEKRS